MAEQTKSWRNVLPVHPAAEFFQPLSADQLKVLGDDIKINGLVVPVILWGSAKQKPMLLDGRNRLDAMEAAGLPVLNEEGTWLHPDIHYETEHGDPYGLVVSVNIVRRHLSTEQTRDLIAKVLKAQPEKSNRTIAKPLKVDHKTVASVRAEKQATGEIPQLAKTTGADGKARTTTPKKTKKPRRDVDDYVAEKKARLALVHNVDAPAPAWAEIVAATEATIKSNPAFVETEDTDALRKQVNALSTEFLIFDSAYSAQVRQWVQTNPDNPYRAMLAGIIEAASLRMQLLAREIRGQDSVTANMSLGEGAAHHERH